MHGSGPSLYVKRERPQYAGLIMVQAEPECGGRNARRKRNDQANQTFIQHSEKRTGREKPSVFVTQKRIGHEQPTECWLKSLEFGPEFKANGTFCVVGPSPYKRKWFAEVTMKDGKIAKVA